MKIQDRFIHDKGRSLQLKKKKLLDTQEVKINLNSIDYQEMLKVQCPDLNPIENVWGNIVHEVVI